MKIKKFLFAVTSLFMTAYFSGCFFLENVNTGGGIVSFRVDGAMESAIASENAARSATRDVISETSSNSLYVEVSLLGGFFATATIPARSGQTATFTDIPVGISLYAQVTAYRLDGAEKTALLYGRSETITIEAGENAITIPLGRSFITIRVRADGTADASSLEEAAKKIISFNSPKNPFTIVVDGTLIGDQIIPEEVTIGNTGSGQSGSGSSGDSENYNLSEYARQIVLTGANGLEFDSDLNDFVPSDVLAGKDDSDGTDVTTLTIKTSVPVIIKNLKITGGNSVAGTDNSGNGGGLYVASGADVTITEGTLITNNSAASYGGGVFVGESAAFSIRGGTISENNAGYSGGGVYAEKNASLTMTDGIISKNTASSSGGGVYVYGGMNATPAVFRMSGGTISGNVAQSYEGGGVYNNGKMFMYGTAVIGDKSTRSVAAADIYSNSAKTKGGGIFVGYQGLLYMGYSSENIKSTLFGGVYHNYVSSTEQEDNSYGGGGIFVGNSDSTGLFMNSGTVAYNASLYGGGVYAYRSAEISGGSITNNAATKVTDDTTTREGRGGGIYVYASAKGTELSGTLTVSGNTADYGAGIYTSTGNVGLVNIKGSVNICNNAADLSGGGIYSQIATAVSGNARISKNSAQVSGGGIYSSDTLVIGGDAVIGGFDSGVTPAIPVVPVDANDNSTIPENCSNYARTDGGGIYSSGSLYIGYSYDVDSSTLKAEDNSNPQIMNNCTITYNETDASSGVIGGAQGGGAIRLETKGMFRMHRGTIAYNYAVGQGGAIYVFKNSEYPIDCEMDGGVIKNNAAYESPNFMKFPNAAIVLRDNDFKMTGGEISSNGIGVVVGQTSDTPVTFTFYGGKIENNEYAAKLYNGTLAMKGDVVIPYDEKNGNNVVYFTDNAQIRIDGAFTNDTVATIEFNSEKYSDSIATVQALTTEGTSQELLSSESEKFSGYMIVEGSEKYYHFENGLPVSDD